MIHTRKTGNWFELTAPAEWSSVSVDDLLRQMWKVPKKLLHELRMDQGIKVNGQPPIWNEPLKQGDRLQLEIFKPVDSSVIPAYLPVEILYEDDHLLVMNKPAGMDTHPNEAQQQNTLANAAAFHLQSEGHNLNVRHIHRLDRDTTGAVLFAKHALAGAMLDRMLEERKIKRTYIAKIDGILRQKKGVIDKPIGRDRHHPTRRRVSPTGQNALTRYEVLQKLHHDDMTLVKCTLDTGRTHQIRVHFSEIGYPLAGDVLYDGSPAYSRQALHAVKMELVHPFTEAEIVIHAPFMDESPIFTNVDPYSV
ncbi:RluA family pseudouridine synthase [Mesobacillus zeae]|uniref:Pseudouridine synthase n=1 Tax=Mesobacillus zeae TaxID=1917180 RepID=A0A398B442_9BACI|nr:RluA family pseudouridine synthase [Mesobacillus zeae]RID84675.1 RluA family pseudouridine synthase [Mesobacillus zeae]